VSRLGGIPHVPATNQQEGVPVTGQAGTALREVISESTWRCRQVYVGKPEQVSRVRAFLRTVLEGCPVADDAVLLASEVAANAALHSNSGRPGGQFSVRTEVSMGRRVRVEIRDQGGPWTLKPARHDGRWHGLDLVNEIASTWGREGDPDSGWLVWFQLDWPGPEALADGDHSG
jgi:anti-sigma regulatory factor (Ser/Thr protein kinase)